MKKRNIPTRLINVAFTINVAGSLMTYAVRKFCRKKKIGQDCGGRVNRTRI